MKSNSTMPPTLPSRQSGVWVKGESGSEVWTEPSTEELIDPNGKFKTIPACPPDEVTIAYMELPALNYALHVALSALCGNESRPIYKVIKSLHKRVNAIIAMCPEEE